MKCSSCSATALPSRKLCAPHLAEQKALYRRVSDVSRGGRSLAEQAFEIGMRREALKWLRFKASEAGLTIDPVKNVVQRGRYSKFAEKEKELVFAGRCRCGLMLPCNSCLPTIDQVAISRRGESAGAF